MKEIISKLQVLQSAAGYYIGRLYYDEEIGCELPYSRESDYYQSKEIAEKILETAKSS